MNNTKRVIRALKRELKTADNKLKQLHDKEDEYSYIAVNRLQAMRNTIVWTLRMLEEGEGFDAE